MHVSELILHLLEKYMYYNNFNLHLVEGDAWHQWHVENYTFRSSIQAEGAGKKSLFSHIS